MAKKKRVVTDSQLAHALDLIGLAQGDFGAGGSGGGGGSLGAWYDGLKAADFKPKAKKKKSGFSWKGLFGDTMEVLDTGLSAVTSATKEVGDLVRTQLNGGNNDGTAYEGVEGNTASFGDWWKQTVDPERELSYGDFLRGNEEKGIAKGLFNGDDGQEGIFNVKPPSMVTSALGLVGDIALDPLSYLGGAGVARTVLARSIATKTAREAALIAAKRGGADLGASAIAKALQNGGDVAENLGKLRQAYKADDEIVALIDRGMADAAGARRIGGAGVKTEGVEGAERGLKFAGKLHVPGTASKPAIALGNVTKKTKAAIGDKFFDSKIAEVFTEANKLQLTKAARSGDPKVAFEAILTQATKDTAKGVASGMRSGWTREFKSLVKGFSDDDLALLPKALEGDEAAKAALGSKHQGVRTLLDKMYKRAEEAGLNIRNIEDFSPRQLSDEGRKLLEEMGLTKGKQGISPLASFEKARTLLANGESKFMGVTLKGTTNAEVRAEVNKIALERLKQVDPKLADEFEGFFKDDIREAMAGYINGVSRRVAAADAASRLYAMGVGNATRELVADPAAQKVAAEFAAAGDEAAARADVLAGRAFEADSGALAIQEHLLGQRQGQLGDSLAGAPHTSPLTDDQTVGLVNAAQRDAVERVESATARLAKLEEGAAKRMEQRGAAAKSLQEDIDALKVQLAHGDPNLERRIAALENEAATWTTRRDSVMAEALAGDLEGVVMPSGWKTQAGEELPVGPWKEVTPKVAWRNAPEIAAAAQDVSTRLPALLEQRKRFADAFAKGIDGRADAAAALDEFVNIASPKQSGDIYDIAARGERLGKLLDSHYSEDGAIIVPKVRKTMERVLKAVREEAKRVERELRSAAPLAEKATRNGDNGLVLAAYYHGTPVRAPGDVLAGAADLEEHWLGNLDGGGLYTTDDQTGRMVAGADVLSEREARRGYMMPTEGSAGIDNSPTAYSYAPKDRDATLLPLDRPIEMDDLNAELSDAIDAHYGGDDWQFADDGDPIADFLIEDAVNHYGSTIDEVYSVAGAERDGLVNEMTQALADGGFGDAYAVLRQHAVDSLSDVAQQTTSKLGGLNVTNKILDSGKAAEYVKAYTDHLYDDLGIKGITRKSPGFTEIEDRVAHSHHIWFRPNDDLEMVGRADFTAAFAEKKAREAVANGTRLTESLKLVDADRVKLASAEGELAKINLGPRPKTAAAKRAEGAVGIAQAQLHGVETHLKDTVEDIVRRRTEHALETRRITTYLDSGAPITDDVRRSLRAYVDDLHDAVFYGRQHAKALEIGDAQLQRMGAMEVTAAEARAEASNLSQRALMLRNEATVISKQKVEAFTKAFHDPLMWEIRKGIGTPQHVAELLMNVDRLNVPAFMKGFDQTVGWLKDFQIATPGFHVRNTMGGEFNNALAGVSMKSRKDFIRVMTGKGTPEEIERYNSIKSVLGHDGGQIGHETGTGLGAGKAFEKTKINPLSRRGPWVRASRWSGERVEFYLRGSLAWHTLGKGGTLDDAVAAVNKFHFDYGDLSKFEQGVRHVVPFYTWTRKNLPLQVEQLFKNPKIYARIGYVKDEIEALSEADPSVPGYFQDLMAIRLPWESNGGHVYATPDLPARDLIRFSGGPGDTLNEAVGMLSPVLKVPIEMRFGKQFFQNIPLSDSKAVPMSPAAALIPGVPQALAALGAARQVKGKWFMTEKEAYALDQLVPPIARLRRMLPQEKKYAQREMTSRLSFLGFGTQTNSKYVQDSAKLGERYRSGADKARNKKFLKTALEYIDQQSG